MRLIFDWELAEQLLKNILLYKLVSYIDSNFARDLKDWKLIIGYCFFLNEAVVY